MLGINTHPSDKEPLGIVDAPESSPPPELEYPEGGWEAWSVVIGAWCAMIPSMGLLNSLGVLHAWTSTHQLKLYSESSVGWVMGAYGFFLYAAGAQAGQYRYSPLCECTGSSIETRPDFRRIWTKLRCHSGVGGNGDFFDLLQLQ